MIIIRNRIPSTHGYAAACVYIVNLAFNIVVCCLLRTCVRVRVRVSVKREARERARACSIYNYIVLVHVQVHVHVRTLPNCTRIQHWSVVCSVVSVVLLSSKMDRWDTLELHE